MNTLELEEEIIIAIAVELINELIGVGDGELHRLVWESVRRVNKYPLKRTLAGDTAVLDAIHTHREAVRTLDDAEKAYIQFAQGGDRYLSKDAERALEKKTEALSVLIRAHDYLDKLLDEREEKTE